MTATHPWVKFYPSDWLGDQALRVVSLGARGLWMECLCIMHGASPYGHLTINGRPVTDAQLATLAGTSPDQIAALLNELETAGVFSRNRNGVIYSRRMTRDEKKRKDGEKSQKSGTLPGSKRGKQASENAKKKSPPPEVTCGVVDQPPSTQKPEARSQNLYNAAAAVAGAGASEAGDKPKAEHVVVGQQIDRIIGWDQSPSHFGDYGRIAGWIQAGWSADLDILPTVKRLMAGRTRKAQGPPRSLDYFENAIREAHAARTKPISEGVSHVRQAPNPHQRRPARTPGEDVDARRRGILDALADDVDLCGAGPARRPSPTSAGAGVG